MEKLPLQSGVFLQPEFFEVLQSGPQKAHWLAFRPEDFLAMGGETHHFLEQFSERYPLSMMAAGLSIGSAESVNETHLQNVSSLVDRYNPCNISTPLAWCRWQGAYLADNLPLPLTFEALDQATINLHSVQNTLGRRILVSNTLQYLTFKGEELPLGQFLEELVRHSGCGIALNVTALYANALNHDRDPSKDLKALPLAAIKEIHLCGQSPLRLNDDKVLIIEDWEEPVSRPVWQLYRELINLLPKPVATLILWRNDKPNAKLIFDDARKADDILEERLDNNSGSKGLAL